MESAEIYKRNHPTRLGEIPGQYDIKLRSDSQPFVITTPRRVSIPLLEIVRSELQQMEDLGVTRKVEHSTDLCAGMVVVAKTKGVPEEGDKMQKQKVCICVDLTKLNESVQTEKHDLFSVDQILGRLAGAEVFMKQDANSGFWQIPLSPSSEELTTFITPFGRYCVRRLPFGITSASEYFQKRMNKMLDGLPGVLCMMDVIIIIEL